MKKSVKNAKLEYYNANNKNKFVGDCLIRAISLAYRLPYTKVSKALRDFRDDINEQKGFNFKYNTKSVYHQYIKSLGYIKFIEQEPVYQTVEDFADTHQHGTYILENGDSKDVTDHIVTIIDGVIYDSWDCRNAWAQDYFIIKDDETNENFLNEDQVQNLNYQLRSYIDEIIPEFVYKMNLADTITTYTISEYSAKDVYSFTFELTLSSVSAFRNTEYIPDCKIRIPITILPYKTFDENLVNYKQHIKQKIYQKLYKFKKELPELEKSYNNRNKDNKFNINLYSPLEKRFYNSLPSWSKYLIEDIYIDTAEGRGNYLYEVDMYPLKDDPDTNIVRFAAYSSSELKNQMEQYKEDFSRPY